MNHKICHFILVEITLKTVTAAELAKESERLKHGYYNNGTDSGKGDDDDDDENDDDDNYGDVGDNDKHDEEEEEKDEEDQWWSARESKSVLSGHSRDLVRSVRSNTTTLLPITDRADKRTNVSDSVGEGKIIFDKMSLNSNTSY